ncbi:MAG: hypothetical protein RIT81_30370 [Deltaproteobacteria bacterium]
MRRVVWILFVFVACSSDPDAGAIASCWDINDDNIRRCADDLPCRHAAYEDPIAVCFEDAGCSALAAWLRCAAGAECPPGPECVAACGTKPTECGRPG